MRRHILLLAAALLAATTGAPSAAAAAPWNAPVTISAAHTFAQPVGLVSTNTSNAAYWQWQQGVGGDSDVGASFASRLPGGTFGPELPLAYWGELLDVRGYDGRVFTLSQSAMPRRSPREPLKFSLRVAEGGGGGLSRAVTVARDLVTSRAQLAVAPGGRAIVSYLTWVPKTNRVLVRVALRSTSGRWSKPAVISGRGQAESVAVAIGRRGDLVVAYVRNKRVLARVRRPGHGWGRVQTLAKPDGPTQWMLRVAAGDSGAVEVLWRKRRLRQVDRPGVRLLQSRSMFATGSRFGATRTIEPDITSLPSELVALPGGFAVAYTVRERAPGTRPIPRVALLTSGAGAPLDVAPASGGLRDVRLAWSQRFGLLATMVQPTVNANSDGIGLGALLAPGAASFGPLEAVTPAENVHEVAPGADRDGMLIAAWSARPEGTGPGIPIDLVRSVVRTATRAG